MKAWKIVVSALTLLLAAALPIAAIANLGGEEATESTDPNWVEGKKAVQAQDWKRASELLSKAAAAAAASIESGRLCLAAK